MQQPIELPSIALVPRSPSVITRCCESTSKTYISPLQMQIRLNLSSIDSNIQVSFYNSVDISMDNNHTINAKKVFGTKINPDICLNTDASRNRNTAK